MITLALDARGRIYRLNADMLRILDTVDISVGAFAVNCGAAQNQHGEALTTSASKDDVAKLDREHGITWEATDHLNRDCPNANVYARILNALDRLEVKQLGAGGFQTDDGSCALGCLAEYADVHDLSYGATAIAKALDIPMKPYLKIIYENDVTCSALSPTERYLYMYNWIKEQLGEDTYS